MRSRILDCSALYVAGESEQRMLINHVINHFIKIKIKIKVRSITDNANIYVRLSTQCHAR